MTMIKRIFSMIIICMICSVNYAGEANHTLRLTLTNRSNETLMIQAISARPSNVIKPNKEVWKPGSSLQIICEDTTGNGLLAHIRFLDGKRRYTDLRIDVREQRHTGQPVIGMNNAYYKSEVTYTRNPNTGGRFLKYIAASMTLQDRQ